MSWRDLERAVLAETRVVTGNPKLRQIDIVEWSTGSVEADDGEAIVRCPELRVNVVVSSSLIKVPRS